MGLDEDFHHLATDFPEALLALLSGPLGMPYRGSSPELKASTRRVDAVLEPEGHDGPSYVVELYAYHHDDALRNLLEKLVGYCRQTGRWGQVEAALIFTRASFAEGLLPVDVELSTTLRFAPMCLVLPDVSPEALLEAAGSQAWVALVALPLIGSEAQVIEYSRSWLDQLRAVAPPGQRPEAVELFLRLLAARLSGKLDVRNLLGEDVMEDTLTGKGLIATGERRVVVRLLQRRLGDAAAPFVSKVESATEAQLEATADLIVDKSDDTALMAALDELLG